MMIPPLKRRVVNENKECDNVWYAFFRKLRDSVQSLAGTKLNANANSGPGGWDDLPPIIAFDPRAASSSPTLDPDLVGYKFSATANNEMYMVYQLSHGWKRGSNIYPHVHVKGLANSNGNVVFRLSTSWSNNLGVQPAFTNVDTNLVMSNASGNIIMKEVIKGLGNTVPPSGARESSIVKYKLYRLGNAAEDTYAGDILLDSFDAHFYKEKAGTDPVWFDITPPPT